MTKLLYLNDTYLYTSTATIVDIIYSAEYTTIILDQTIFYPQGGGQPSDTGYIIGDNGSICVNHVYLDPSGIVYHQSEPITTEMKIGDTVQLSINQANRIIHAQLHTAGHLVDCVIQDLQLSELTPLKGYHYPQGSYMEYSGLLLDESKLIHNIQIGLCTLINNKLSIYSKQLTIKQAHDQGISIPYGKSARIVYIDGYPPIGCGGTHLDSTSQLPIIHITKIKTKKGNTKISYNLIID